VKVDDESLEIQATKQDSIWKSFLKLIPYLSAVIIIFSLIKQALYFGQYDVEIQNYIGIQELLLPISSLSLFDLITFIFPLLAFNINLNQIVPLEELKDGTPHRWKKYLHILISMGIVFIIIVVLLHYNANPQIINSLFGFIFIFSYPIMYVEFPILYFRMYKKAFQIWKLKVFYYLICVVFFINQSVLKETYDTNKGKYNGTQIFTKDSIYISDKSNHFIGKTEKYFFIHNKDNSMLILPERDVIKFNLKVNE
jgi:hypothetical protein